jgi:hypothetical protein
MSAAAAEARIPTRFIGWIGLGMLATAVGACGPEARQGEVAPPVAAAAATAPPAEPTLKLIMQGLRDDMAAVAAGIWQEDDSAVATAAGRIAAHPQVTAAERSTIQATLGVGFPRFARYDHAVHEAATELASQAARREPIPALLIGYQKIEQRCVACHGEFRQPVAAALAAGAVAR